MTCDNLNPFKEAIKKCEGNFLIQSSMQPVAQLQQSKSAMHKNQKNRENMSFENCKNIDSQSYIEMLPQQHSHGSFQIPPFQPKRYVCIFMYYHNTHIWGFF